MKIDDEEYEEILDSLTQRFAEAASLLVTTSFLLRAEKQKSFLNLMLKMFVDGVWDMYQKNKKEKLK